MKRASLIAQHDAFGWSVSHLSLPAGVAYSYIVSADTDRSLLPAVSFWTRGRVTGVNVTTGAAIDDRVPGTLTSALARVVRAGRFVLTAEQDSEWWCIAAKTNRGQLPGLSSFDLTSGQSATLDPGQRLLICSGSASFGPATLGPGECAHALGAMQIHANSSLLGLFFDRSLP